MRAVELMRARVPSFDDYPFVLPVVRGLGRLDLDPRVTFLVGENGSGKSTLVEAIAVAAGFNAEGGSKNFAFATRSTESPLHEALRLIRGARREKDGFFLRPESLYTLATEVERLGLARGDGYGGRSLHARSHGEALLALVAHRFRGGLYLMDEPEAALSPCRQLALLVLIDRLVRQRASQLVIATHSPILLAYPGALIYELSERGIAPVAYETTEHFRVTRDFLADPGAYLHHLVADAALAKPAEELEFPVPRRQVE